MDVFKYDLKFIKSVEEIKLIYNGIWFNICEVFFIL